MIDFVSNKPHYENVPFEIPESWEWVRLDEVCNIKGGKRIPKGKGFSDFPTKHIYIRVTDMKKNTILDNDIQYIDEEVFTEICNYTISKDDLYLTIAGTIGAVGEVPELFDGMNLTENAAKLTHIQCNKKYLMYALLSTSSQEHFKSRFHQVAQPKLSIETAASTNITLPPLTEQQRIVSELQKWFSLIDKIDQDKVDLQKHIKQIKSKVLDIAIHGKLVPQDPNDEPAIELLKRINPNFKSCDTSHYENLPSGWTICPLNQVTNIARGGSPRPIKDYITTEANGINWIKIGDTEKNGKYINETKEKIKPEGVCRSRMICKGDFLLTNSMSFGRPYISNIEGCIHDGWLVISPINNIYDKDFLYHLLSSSYAYSQFSEKASGTAVSNLNVEKVANALFPLPPLDEQKRIADNINIIFNHLDTIIAEL